MANDACWVHEDMCSVKAEIFQNLEFLNGIAMQIDCSVSDESDTTEAQQDTMMLTRNSNDGNDSGGADQHRSPTTTSAAYILLRHFMGKPSVMLDGCQTPLNTHTYGLEFLSVCANVTKVALHHFHMDSLIPLQCGSADADQQLELEYLLVHHNEIATIDNNSFAANYPHLRVLEVESNSLKIIEGNSFRTLRSLEHLRIVNEPVLMLKSPDIFEYTAAIVIHLEALKQMTSEIFHHLPETVESLYVAFTQLDRDAVEVYNARTLANLTIASCALEKFTLRDIHSTVKTINLNGNALKSFEAHENNLKELDLSNNQLEHFDCKWTVNLTGLEVLSLKQNHIKTINIYEIVQAIPNGRTVDVRENRLQALQNADIEFPSWLSTQLRLRCDHNPWDCLWLHEFAHSHPEKFRILQYDKFISKINVNGLECIPAEKPLETHTKDESKPSSASSGATPASNKILNMSAYHLVYGDPYDYRRNQRAEALIIVFMLPVGIAFLFLLLYMWIFCQKMFHVSYYKNFSCLRRQPNVPNPSQRFDVVRQIPNHHLQQVDSSRSLTVIHDQEDGCYEVPLNGLCSECNCKSRASSVGSCTKAIHITYEESPTETSHQIYEEIISLTDNDFASQEDNALPNNHHHLNYDHLRFE